MTSPTDLLKSLAGVHASRVCGVSPTSSTQPAPPPEQSFAALLEQAKAGKFESGVPLRVPSHLGIQLSESQSSRLSKAIDQAEAQGAQRCVVLMDGKGYSVDVATRTVSGAIDASVPGVLDGIDAMVIAAPEPKEGNDARSAISTGPKATPALQPNISRLFESENADSAAA